MKSARFNKNLLESAVSFHGHLGPYLVLGLRMGVLANRILKPRGLHDLSVTVWTRRSPPKSCLLDGIQFSSGCTLGRGNLRVRNASRIRARFHKGKQTILVEPTGETEKLLCSVSRRTTVNRIKMLAISLASMPEKALFTVKRVRRAKRIADAASQVN